MVCVSVPYPMLHEHTYPYCFLAVVSLKDCLQTNYGDVVMKYIAIPVFLFMLVSYIIFHCSLMWCTHVYCLPRTHDNNVVTMLQHRC